MSSDKQPLLGNEKANHNNKLYIESSRSSGLPTTKGASVDQSTTGAGENDDHKFIPLKDKTWSFSHSRRHVATEATATSSSPLPPALPPALSRIRRAVEDSYLPHTSSFTTSDKQQHPSGKTTDTRSTNKGLDYYVFCFIYAVVNVVIAVPGLFGYAAVIFNHPIYGKYMNSLSKLLISSSLVHQLGFTLFSSLSFAIGTVQDAGLIFLSAMANTIANTMIDDGQTESEILSTTLVLLCSGTALLGLVLIVMGKFKLANAVSFLPMPVVGGYLAFIGYFCVLAGTSLCISKSMTSLTDWNLLLDFANFRLALPGLVTGLFLTLTSRFAESSGTLPLVMVSIPILFYVIVWTCGSSIEEVRETGWVGQISPAVPVSALFKIIDFSQVRWDLVLQILPTWFGMVFVVSFASCLDVAAISIDMGQPLDTNRELATVGLCNVFSGLSVGFTGSYIFSQTIFTYRTGIHDRCIGVLIMIVYAYIIGSPVNILEVAPLFFLGSTLIFIGYDLMYEWLWEVRHQVFLSEYFIVWLTFVSIHAVGINFGILIGIVIAICDQIFTTAQSTGVNRVEKRSRAVYSPGDAKVIHEKAYCSFGPKIVTLEVIGNLFFGSSLSILNRILEETGLSIENATKIDSLKQIPEAISDEKYQDIPYKSLTLSMPPKYVVLDLMGVTHLDASATRGCFLQLAKMAAQKSIIVCASGLSPKIEWMFRSHEVAFETVEEEGGKKVELLDARKRVNIEDSERILIFTTAAESLEFCENLLLQSTLGGTTKAQCTLNCCTLFDEEFLEQKSKEHSISHILSAFLGCIGEQKKPFDRLDDLRYHKEIIYKAGQTIFSKRGSSHAFYVVLNGCVANSTASAVQASRQQQSVMSGAGKVTSTGLGSAASGTIATLWQVGSIFGFNDYLLGRKRTFQTIATLEDTKVAVFTHSGMSTMHTQDPELYSLMQQVLLRASTLDLANCTCHDV